MTVANAFCADDRAWVMADTAGAVGQERIELAHWLQLMPVSFDGIEARWPSLAQEAHDSARFGDPNYTGGQRLAVVGWSEKAGRPMVHAAAKERNGDAYVGSQQRAFVTPWQDGMTLPARLEQGEVLAFARQQVDHGYKRGIPSFGGRLILAELTRETTYFRSLPLSD